MVGRWLFNLLALIYLATISSCSISHSSKQEKVTYGQAEQVIGSRVSKHILSIAPEGAINEGAIRNLSPSSVAKTDSEAIDQVDYIVEAIKERKETLKRIVIFVHGGLVDELSLVRRVNSVLGKIPDDTFPVFINWQSGLLDTYPYQLFKVRNGELSRWAKYNWPVHFITDIADIIVQAPKSWTISGSHAFDSGVRRKQADIDESLASYGKQYSFVNVVDNGRLPSKFWNSVKWWTASPGKLVATPVAHVIGKPAWDEMLRRADNVVFPGVRGIDEIVETGYKLPGNYRTSEGVPISAVGAFLKRITDLKTRAISENRTFEVDVVGHSMGAIIVNRLLRGEYQFQFDNIVHMASADTVDAIFTTVFPYLERYRNSRFYSLHLHPHNEERERNVFGLAPTGSLLVYIEDMYTTPDSVMSRRSGVWDNIARVFDRLPLSENLETRINFTVFGIDENADENKKNRDSRITHPQKHGEFSRTRFWLPETWLGKMD